MQDIILSLEEIKSLKQQRPSPYLHTNNFNRRRSTQTRQQTDFNTINVSSQTANKVDLEQELQLTLKENCNFLSTDDGIQLTIRETATFLPFCGAHLQ
jgi:hypothetical protein